MAFDHEKLDVYRLAVRFSSWVGERLETENAHEQTAAAFWTSLEARLSLMS